MVKIYLYFGLLVAIAAIFFVYINRVHEGFAKRIYELPVSESEYASSIEPSSTKSSLIEPSWIGRYDTSYKDLSSLFTKETSLNGRYDDWHNTDTIWASTKEYLTNMSSPTSSPSSSRSSSSRSPSSTPTTNYVFTLPPRSY